MTCQKITAIANALETAAMEADDVADDLTNGNMDESQATERILEILETVRRLKP